VFHAASIGRGSAVTMTVSSMSDTTAKRTSGARMRTGASTGSAPARSSRTLRHPGSGPASTTASM
jgi:hypothetical protein